MLNSKGNHSASLSYLLTFGLVAFTRYSIHPWLLLHIHARKYESWAQAVVSYGILLTFFNMGISVGQNTTTQANKLSKKLFIVMFLTLSISYIAIAFVTRFAMLMLLIFVMGLSGALLSGFSLSLDKGSPTVTFHRKYSEIDPNSNLERGVICFTFSTLLGSFLYDGRSMVNCPAFFLAVFLGVVCILMTLYYLILAAAVAQKSIPVRGINSANASRQVSGNTANPVPVEIEADYEGDVPLNFLSNCRGDLTKARKMYGKALAWRKQNRVDEIFQIPQRHFEDVIKYYPHAIHGYSLDGCGVVYEVLGRGKPKELEATGITIDELVWHFNIRNELVLTELCKPETLQAAIAQSPPGAITITPFPYKADKGGAMDKPVPRLMTVIDVQGISISSVTTTVISFIKKSGEIVDNYYPEQVARLVVCRAPRWFSTIWTVIARVLPESVQKKVDILYDSKGLDKYIHPSQRPQEYGGTGVELGQWEGHLCFLQIAENWRKQALSLSLEPVDISSANGHQAGNSKGTRSGFSTAGSSVQASPHKPTGASSASGFQTKQSTSSSNLNNNNGSNSSGSGNGVPRSQSGGVMDWLTNRFSKSQGGKKGAASSAKTPTAAYLGEKNSYRYNSATGRWEIEVDNLADDNDDVGNSSAFAGRDDDLDSLIDPNEEAGDEDLQEVDLEQQSSAIPFLSGSPRRSVSNSSSQALKDHHFNGSNAANLDNTYQPALKRSTSNSHSNTRRSRRKKRMTQEQIEEHGLVLAIQAAHFASKFAQRGARHPGQSLSMSTSALMGSTYLGNSLEMGHSGGSSAGALTLDSRSGLLDDHAAGVATSNLLGSTTALENSNGTDSTQNLHTTPVTKLSSSIFLIVSCIFLLTTSSQMMLVTLLPVWLCAPLRSGGLGYGVKDLGLQLSCCGMFVLHAHLLCASKFDHVLRASPVRALRIGSGLMTFCIFFLLFYARWHTAPIEDVLHHSHEAVHFGLEEQEHAAAVRDSMHHDGLLAHDRAWLEAENAVTGYLHAFLPSTSLFSMIICAALLSTLVCAAHLCRKAAGMLLHLVLGAVFQSPANIRHALYALADILGPLLSCAVYSIMYASHLRFPLNSGFFLPIAASMGVLTYLCSMFLVVHFRGDYGIMSDHAEWKVLTAYYFGTSSSHPSGHKYGASSNNNSNHSHNNSSSQVAAKSPIRGLQQRNNVNNTSINNMSSSSAQSSTANTPHFSFNPTDDAIFDNYSHHSNENNGNIYGGESYEHLLSIPLGDIHLLFSSAGLGYGSKLYNLKDDFKDV